MSVNYKQTRTEGLPVWVKKETAEIWQKQRSILDSNTSIKNGVYMIDWPDFMNDKNEQKAEKLTEWHNMASVKDSSASAVRVDMPTIWVKKDSLYDIISFLKEDKDFEYGFLADLTSADFLNSPDLEDEKKNQGKRFQMIYTLRSLKNKGALIRVVMPINEDEKSPSLTKFWVGANWPEREVFDLMGISFENHPNLKRILMPDNFKGHPLRKDFPLKGRGEDYLIEDLLKERLIED
ncbi:MAG: NADH-quinone oxidoreductase subunit C [Spirochaetia bacterium]|nr:NADH-quinone oxidoreductase subunit C [Spirochaetia bacterium]